MNPRLEEWIMVHFKMGGLSLDREAAIYLLEELARCREELKTYQEAGLVGD